MTFIERVVLLLIAALVLVTGTAVVFYKFGHSRGYDSAEKKLTAVIKTMEATSEKHVKELTQKGLELEQQLRIAEGKATVKEIEVIKYVYKNASPDRAALDADLTRMLNTLSGIREVVASPPAAEPPADPGPAPAADPSRHEEGTSERALSEWIAEAVTSYESCRQKANALIEYAKACSGESK